MKKLLSIAVIVLALSSCAVKTVSRSELFTPNAITLINPDELTQMKYYGADNQYDYFSRGFQRLRVAKTENAVPSSARFTFNNWQGGKKYTDCLAQSTVSQLQSLLTGKSSYTAQPVNTPTTTTTTNTSRQQKIQALQTLLKGISQQ